MHIQELSRPAKMRKPYIKFIFPAIALSVTVACMFGCSTSNSSDNQAQANNTTASAKAQPQISPEDAKKQQSEMFAHQGEYWRKKAKELEEKKKK